jgi:hypothetical protein
LTGGCRKPKNERDGTRKKAEPLSLKKRFSSLLGAVLVSDHNDLQLTFQPLKAFDLALVQPGKPQAVFPQLFKIDLDRLTGPVSQQDVSSEGLFCFLQHPKLVAAKVGP